jgi:hypothetical protein
MNRARWRLVAGTLTVLLAVLSFAAPAAARPTPIQSAVSDGSLGCTVPAGYVYDSASYTLKCSPGLTYHLRVPANYVWSCAGPYVSIPSGFTYDLTLVSGGQCDPSNSQLWKYELRVPVAGLWACLVPAGFGYDQVISSNRCNPSNPYANLYHLHS